MEIKRTVMINTITKITSFSNDMNKFPFPVDVSCGKYTVNGKSITGLFALEVTKPVTVVVHTEKEGDEGIVLELLNKYTI